MDRDRRWSHIAGDFAGIRVPSQRCFHSGEIREDSALVRWSVARAIGDVPDGVHRFGLGAPQLTLQVCKNNGAVGVLIVRCRRYVVLYPAVNKDILEPAAFGVSLRVGAAKAVPVSTADRIHRRVGFSDCTAVANQSGNCAAAVIFESSHGVGALDDSILALIAHQPAGGATSN